MTNLILDATTMNPHLKYLIPNNYRMVGINLININLFSGLSFVADVMYFNKNHYKI